MRLQLVVAIGLGWWGAVLLLSSIRRFRRPRLTDRLRPYLPGLPGTSPMIGDDRSSLAAILGPIARDGGAAAARLLGVEEDLAVRLARVHSPIDPTDFRLRQFGWMAAAFGIGALLAATVAPPFVLLILLLVGPPLLAFLLIESSLSTRSERHQRRLLLELPVVSEQLGMLLSAGYSLGAALARISQRSDGAMADDLRRVVARIGHGVDETTALTEWADLADVPAITRFVGVLALDREAGDLGRLITEEARAARAELHRGLVETIEKRTQQVWIPVTVATLVPGLLFLAVPFTEALQLFSNG